MKSGGTNSSGTSFHKRHLTQPDQEETAEVGEDGYQSPAFLCRKIREAFNQENPDYLSNLIHQLANALRSPHPEDLKEIFEFDIITILVKFARDDSFPWLRHYSINCLVSLAADEHPNIRDVFQKPEFCDLAIELMNSKTLPKAEVHQAIQLVANILCARNQQVHEYVVSKLNIGEFIQLADTSSGDVIEEVLFCLKVIAVFPVNEETSRAMLRVVAFAARNPQVEFADSALLVLLRLILSKSLDVVEFKSLGLCRFLEQCLEFPLQRVVSTACKVINKVYSDYDFSYPSVTAKIIQQLDSDATASSAKEEASVSCVGALKAILSKEEEVRTSLIRDGFVKQLMDIFTRKNAVCKVLIIGLLDTIMSQCNQAQYETIMECQTPEFSVVTMALEVCELGDPDSTRKCLTFINNIVTLAVRFGYTDRIRPLLHCLETYVCVFPAGQEMIEAIKASI